MAPEQAFGFDTDFGYAEETVYGTRVAPTNFNEINTESLQLTQAPIAKVVLNSASENSFVLSKRDPGGSVEMCIPYQGSEILFKHLTGGVPTSAQQGGSAAWKHTFVLADNMLTGLSLYMSKDGDAIGTAYAYPGSQISALTLTQDVESQLIGNWEFKSKDETEVAVVTPTFPASNAVDWTQLSTATFGGNSVDAMATEVKIENPLAEDRFKLGDRLRKGLGRGAVRKISGKVTLEFDDIVEYNLFRNSTETAIILEWVGGIADGAENFKFKITVPRAVFTGTTPNAGEIGPLSMDMTFMGFTGTSAEDAIKIEITNLLTSIP